MEDGGELHVSWTLSSRQLKDPIFTSAACPGGADLAIKLLCLFNHQRVLPLKGKTKCMLSSCSCCQKRCLQLSSCGNFYAFPNINARLHLVIFLVTSIKGCQKCLR